MSSNDDSYSTDIESDEDESIVKPFHGHRKRISIIEISTRNYVKKTIVFETRCSQLPSSWEVDIELKKGPWFENFVISITLKRIDIGEIPLEGNAWVFLSNFNDDVCPVGYHNECEIPYFEVTELSGESFKKLEMRKSFRVSDHYRCLYIRGGGTFLHDMLLLKTQFVVSNCCAFSTLKHNYFVERNE